MAGLCRVCTLTKYTAFEVDGPDCSCDQCKKKLPPGVTALACQCDPAFALCEDCSKRDEARRKPRGATKKKPPGVDRKRQGSAFPSETGRPAVVERTHTHTHTQDNELFTHTHAHTRTILFCRSPCA
jgi:hypothetical protein